MVAYFYTLFNTSLSEMTFFKLLIAVLISVSACYILFKILFCFKSIGRGCKKIAYNTTHYSKIRCSKVQCPYCGRTLDKCNCVANQGLSYRKRIKRYKKTRK